MQQRPFFIATLLVSFAFMSTAILAEGYKPQVKSQVLHRATTTSNGAPIAYPHTDHPEVSTLDIVIPPGAETGWHKHPAPLYTYILSGSVEVELEDGEKTTFSAGDVVYEVVDTWHNGVNRGTVDARLIVFALGTEGKALVIPRE
ncbi:MAG: cupin [Gammaproteobacteria bacterium BRH_c0]|nr:MAG: cupin [Gammaproteobacteria bacterium BRH_c0]